MFIPKPKYTKADVGLNNVDNTTDLAKPISTAVQNALNGKQPTGSYATKVDGKVTSDQLPEALAVGAIDTILSNANNTAPSSHLLNTFNKASESNNAKLLGSELLVNSTYIIQYSNGTKVLNGSSLFNCTEYTDIPSWAKYLIITSNYIASNAGIAFKNASDVFICGNKLTSDRFQKIPIPPNATKVATTYVTTNADPFFMLFVGAETTINLSNYSYVNFTPALNDLYYRADSDEIKVLYSSGAIVITGDSGKIYQYGNKQYYWNGTKLVDYTKQRIIKLYAFASSFTGLSDGQIGYNTSTNLLRKWNASANAFFTYPFDVETIYLWNNDQYVYNGSELEKITENQNATFKIKLEHLLVGHYTAADGTTGSAAYFNCLFPRRFKCTAGDYLAIYNTANTLITGVKFLFFNSAGNLVDTNGTFGGRVLVPANAVTFSINVAASVTGSYLAYSLANILTWRIVGMSYVSTDERLSVLENSISSGEIKPTNINSFIYSASKKVLLSGASIASYYNGFFEYACQSLGLVPLNTSVPGSNIMYLANALYNSNIPSATPNVPAITNFSDIDVLLLSHTHNWDLSKLPTAYENYKASDYESNNIVPYAGSTMIDEASHEVMATFYDYVVKKWAAICYANNKPFQVGIFTFWHDGRTYYNEGVRRFAKKHGLTLIADDENIGFSRTRLHPETGAQWSLLYGDTTGWTPSEIMTDGQSYGLHPERVSSANLTTFSATGVMDESYLPFIQKKRAKILKNYL